MQLPLSWIPALLCVAFVLGWVGAWALRRRTRKPDPLPRVWALSARPVFNTDERRIHRQLREAFPHHIVLSKLPLVRFCQPTDPQRVRYWFDLLGATHVSFAVCSANGRVLAAVDLEGERGSSRRSVHIKRSVLGACQVRYLRCTAGALPSLAELQKLVPASTAPQTPPSVATVSQSRDRLASTVASRRLERNSMWQESESAPDTGQSAWPTSQRGAADIAGVVTDHPARAPLRH